MKKTISVIASIVLLLSILLASLSFVSNHFINNEIINENNNQQILKSILTSELEDAVSAHPELNGFVPLAVDVLIKSDIFNDTTKILEENIINDIDSNAYSDTTKLENEINKTLEENRSLLDSILSKEQTDYIINKIETKIDVQKIYNQNVDKLRAKTSKLNMSLISLVKTISKSYVLIISLLLIIASLITIIVIKQSSLKFGLLIGLPCYLDAFILLIVSFVIDYILTTFNEKYNMVFNSNAKSSLMLIAFGLVIVGTISLFTSKIKTR